LQAIHLSQNEYINAFGTDTWRKALRSSVNVNYDYRFPSNPTHAEACHPERSEGPCLNPASSTIDETRHPSAPAPAEACHPERSEGPCPNPASSTIDETRLPSAPAPVPQPATNHSKTQTKPTNNTPPAAPPRHQPTTPNHDPYPVHLNHNPQLQECSKLL
jgi:hypothetical protein